MTPLTSRPDLEMIKVVKPGTPNEYMALLKFRTLVGFLITASCCLNSDVMYENDCANVICHMFILHFHLKISFSCKLFDLSLLMICHDKHSELCPRVLWDLQRQEIQLHRARHLSPGFRGQDRLHTIPGGNYDDDDDGDGDGGGNYDDDDDDDDDEDCDDDDQLLMGFWRW